MFSGLEAEETVVRGHFGRREWLARIGRGGYWRNDPKLYILKQACWTDREGVATKRIGLCQSA